MTAASRAPKSKLDLRVGIGLFVVILFFLGSGTLAYRNISMLRADAARIQHTHEVIISLERLMSTMQDAETGQRGFLLTGDDRYLAPYEEAVSSIEPRLDAIAALTRDNPTQVARLTSLRRHAQAKLAELGETINTRRSEGEAASRAIVNTDRGKVEMDGIRDQLSQMQQEETRLRQERISEMDVAYATAWVSSILTALLGVLITVIVGLLVRRAAAARNRQQWLQTGQADLSAAMLGDQQSGTLGENVLSFLSEFLGAQGGAVFSRDGASFERVATLGVPAGATVVDRFAANDGLLGRAVADKRQSLIDDVPEGYLTIGSGLGQGQPRHLTISPANLSGTTKTIR